MKSSNLSCFPSNHRTLCNLTKGPSENKSNYDKKHWIVMCPPSNLINNAVSLYCVVLDLYSAQCLLTKISEICFLKKVWKWSQTRSLGTRKKSFWATICSKCPRSLIFPKIEKCFFFKKLYILLMVGKIIFHQK